MLEVRARAGRKPVLDPLATLVIAGGQRTTASLSTYSERKSRRCVGPTQGMTLVQPPETTVDWFVNSAAKRSNCLFVVISNAGFADSWQLAVCEAARTDQAWHFSRLDGPRVSSLSPAMSAEQRRMLPAVACLRFWENQWSSGGGDALTPTDLSAASGSKAEGRLRVPARLRGPGRMFRILAAVTFRTPGLQSR